MPNAPTSEINIIKRMPEEKSQYQGVIVSKHCNVARPDEVLDSLELSPYLCFFIGSANRAGFSISARDIRLK